MRNTLADIDRYSEERERARSKQTPTVKQHKNCILVCVSVYMCAHANIHIDWRVLIHTLYGQTQMHTDTNNKIQNILKHARAHTHTYL